MGTRKKSKRNYLNKFISSLYLLAVLFTSLMPLTDVLADTDADGAKANQQELIKVYQGKENNLFDNNTNEESKAIDFQAMGVFLSNFYVPYQTTFDSKIGSDGKVTIDETTQKGLSEALDNLTNMSDEDKKVVLSRVIGNMADPNTSSKADGVPKQLYLGKYDGESGEGGYIKASKLKDGIAISYYDFLGLILGDSEVISSIKSLYSVKDDDQLALYYSEGEGNKAVFKISLDPSNPTPSQVAMSVIYKNANNEKTYSNSFLGGSDLPKGKQSDKLKENVDKYYNTSMYGWKMYVDTFGNILIDNGQKRTVIMPACMNPILFTKNTITVDGKEVSSIDKEKDKDKDIKVSTKKAFGNYSSVPLNNVLAMQYYNNGDINNKDGKTTVKLPHKDWFSEISTDKAEGSKIFFLFSHKGEEASQGYYVMSLLSKKGDSDGVSWDAGGKDKGSDNWDTGYDDVENMLDQITFKHFNNQWNPNGDTYTAITYKDKSILAKELQKDSLLPTGQRFILLKTDDIKKLEIDGKEGSWDKVTGGGVHTSSWGGHLKIESSGENKVHILNEDEVKNNKVLDVSVGNLDKSLRFSNGVIRSNYPFRVNFTKPNQEDYVVIPKSNLNKTRNIAGIDQMYNPEDSGGTSENLAGSYSSIFGKNSMYEKALKVVGTPSENKKASLNADLSKTLGKEVGLSLFLDTMIRSHTPINGESGSIDGTVGVPEYSMRFTNTPKFSFNTVAVVKSDKADSDAGSAISIKKANELMDLSFNWMNPVGGAKYIATWVSNKMNAIVYDLHSRITGSNSSSYYTGAGLYNDTNSFVYQPKMSDTGFTASIKNNYDKWAIYLIMLMFMAVALYVIRGDFSIQKGIVQFIIFCVFISIPIRMTDTIIGVSNSVSSSFFTKKFNYFAVFQLENSVLQIKEGVNTEEGTTKGEVAKQEDAKQDESKDEDASKSKDDKDSKDDSKSKGSNLETVDVSSALDESDYEMAVTNYSNNENASGVSLRWMAPRKDNYNGFLVQAFNKNLNLSETALGWVSGSSTKNMSHQEIRGTSNNLYVTRQLSDITAVSRVIYNNVLGSGQDHLTDNYSGVLSASPKDLAQPVMDYLGEGKGDTITEKEKKGFINSSNNGNEGFANTHKRALGVISSLDMAEATKLTIKGKEVTPDTKFGIASEQFNATKEAYAKDSTAFQERIDESGTKDTQNKDDAESSKDLDLNAPTVAGTGMFAIYSESPYYHFSWTLMDNGMSSKFDTAGTTKTLLLGDENGKSSFFYNKTLDKNEPGYNEIKDFSDLSTLFHVTIPYLHRMNQQYQDFVNQYGLQMYEHIPLTGPESNGIGQDDPNYHKYWYNYNLARLQNQYTPWVDFMYAADYSKSETIKYAGHEYTVKDPLNPEDYLDKDSNGKVKGRPMVFSKSEMEYYGLEEANLTKVEQKIIEYNDNARMAILPLMNYYTFHDSTMTSIIAMTELFEFNKVFSQNGLFGSKGQLTMEPQSWSVSDFSYDAYLRLILANSTGESLSFVQGNGTNKERGEYEVDAGDDIDKQDSGVTTNDNNYATSVNGNIYERILAKTNWFIGILMVVSDIITMYLLSLLRYAFLIGVLILSVLILIVLILTTEANLKSLIKKSIVSPLLKVVISNIAFAFIISKFLSNGINTVTGNLDSTISMGVGATIIAILFLECVLMLVYYNVIRKMIQDIINIGQVAVNSVKYLSSVATNVVSGAVGGGGVGNFLSKTFNPRSSQSSDISGDDLYGSNQPKFSSRGGGNSSSRDSQGGKGGYNGGSRRKFNKKQYKEGSDDHYRDEFNKAMREGKDRLEGENLENSEPHRPSGRRNNFRPESDYEDNKFKYESPEEENRKKEFKKSAKDEYDKRQSGSNMDLSEILKRGRKNEERDD